MKPRTIAGLAVLLLLAGMPAVSQPIFEGDEMRLEGTGGTRTRIPTVGFHRSGRFVVAWEDQIDGVSARFFHRTGSPAGGNQVLVANDSMRPLPFRGVVSSRREPVVVMGPDRSFFLFWTEEVAEVSIDIFFESRDVLERDIFGQLFEFGGQPLGPSFQVNTSSEGFQRRPAAARAANGDTLVVWQSETESESLGVFGRLFDAEGHPLSGELRIDEGSGDVDSGRPALAMRDDGTSLVVWEGCCDDAGDLGIYGRFFDGSTAPLSDPFLLNTTTAENQRVPVAVRGPSDRFLVAWQGPTGEVDETEREIFRVYARVAQLGLGAVGEEVIASSGIGRGHSSPALAPGARGEVLLAWMSWVGDLRLGVFGSRVAIAADEVLPLGEAFQISQNPIGGQFRLSATTTPTGRFLVAWEGFNDDDALGITARLVMPAAADGCDGSGVAPSSLQDGVTCPP